MGYGPGRFLKEDEEDLPLEEEEEQAHNSLDPVSFEEISYFEIPNVCLEEPYDLGLVVKQYLFLTALPSNTESNYPPLVVDARF